MSISSQRSRGTPRDPSRLGICVFCGSSLGSNPAFVEAAKSLGRAIAAAGRPLIYGGASVGLMGVVADAALEAGGEVVGVLPKSLETRELAHPSLTELIVVDSMAARKDLMAERSLGFVTLPGGYGTLDEMFEMLTAIQIGDSKKPCAFLNVERYFDDLLRFLDRAVADQLLSRSHRDFAPAVSTADEAIAWVTTWQPPAAGKWG